MNRVKGSSCRRAALGCFVLAAVFGGHAFAAAAPGDKPELRRPPSPTASRVEVEPAAVEGEIIAAFEKIKLAVVRIAVCRGGREMILGCGVIVTPEGHVATVDDDLRPVEESVAVGESVSLLLADGRHASATQLGRCPLWKLSLMKINDNGPWPYVELGRSADVRPGQLCLALGWVSPMGMLGSESRPVLRLGGVCISGAPGWFGTTCRMDNGDFGGGLFDMRGRLVGLNVSTLSSRSGIHVAIDQVQRHWRKMAAGKVIDPLASGRPASPTTIGRPPIRSKTRSELRDELAVAAAKAAPASVRVCWVKGERRRGRAGGPSGTIVTADGYVVTCEHHHYPPTTPVIVFLPDGREAAGKVLRSDPLWDVGLVKITDPGPWPHVELGNSLSTVSGDPCLFLGYPSLNTPDGTPYREPKARERMSRIAQTPAHWSEFAASSAVATTLTDRQNLGGDSGGGLFDREGRLVGVLKGGWGLGNDLTQFPRIELVKQEWKILGAEDPVVGPEQGLGALGIALRRVTSDATSATVEVLSDGRRLALGTIVGGDGWILTKASELYGSISCRLADGRSFQAESRGVAREHDLALLKIGAAGLPEVRWSTKAAPPGTLIAAPGAGKPAAVGVVAGTAHPVSREAGWLLVGSMKDTQRGIQVFDDSGARKRGTPIRKGDILLHVAGHPTPDLKTLVKMTEEPGVGVSDVFAGDPIRVGVRRGDQTLEFCFPLASESSTEETQSHRRSGFPSVMDVDISMRPDWCGGPVVDRYGRVVGVTIACRTGRALVYAVPASVASEVVSRLKAKAK